MNRRQFLFGSTALAVAAALPPARAGEAEIRALIERKWDRFIDDFAQKLFSEGTATGPFPGLAQLVKDMPAPPWGIAAIDRTSYQYWRNR